MAPRPRPTVQAPPPPAPPGDVAWWVPLITAIIASVLSVYLTLRWKEGQSMPSGPPGMGALFSDIITFLPHILILFGIFADIFTLQGAYSIPSLVGILSLPAHKAFSFLWAGTQAIIADFIRLATTAPAALARAAEAPLANFPSPPPSRTTPKPGNYKSSTFDSTAKGGAMSAWSGCEVYGFEMFISEYAPQGLVVTSTIFWYYLIDLLVNRNFLDSIATIFAFTIFFGLQIMQLSSCENLAKSVAIKSLVALAEGLMIGGAGYGIVQSFAPERLPSYVLPKGPLLSSLKKNPNGTYTGKDGTVYVLGPDGRPIPQSFFTSAAKANSPASSSTTTGARSITAAMMGPASKTTCST